MSKQIQVGDPKSLDFVGNDSCYLFGRVISISQDDGTFTAECHGRVWEGKADSRIPDRFTAPLQGNHFMDSDQNPRVTVINLPQVPAEVAA
jgi:hypothetical protein